MRKFRWAEVDFSLRHGDFVGQLVIEFSLILVNDDH